MAKLVRIDELVLSKRGSNCDLGFGDQCLQWLGNWMEKCVDCECEGRKVELVDKLPGMRWMNLMEIRTRYGQYRLYESCFHEGMVRILSSNVLIVVLKLVLVS